MIVQIALRLGGGYSLEEWVGRISLEEFCIWDAVFGGEQADGASQVAALQKTLQGSMPATPPKPARAATLGTSVPDSIKGGAGWQ